MRFLSFIASVFYCMFREKGRGTIYLNPYEMTILDLSFFLIWNLGSIITIVMKITNNVFNLSFIEYIITVLIALIFCYFILSKKITEKKLLELYSPTISKYRYFLYFALNLSAFALFMIAMNINV